MRLLILLLPLLMAATPIEPHWHWESAFSAEERQGLQAWVRHSLAGLHQLVGRPRQPMHVHFRRSQRSHEPVPWANTWKSDAQRVFFHVDCSHDWDTFHADWTASHELVHLLFPYLGQDSRWFAEGIASYLQYQVMHASGVLSWDQAIQRYRGRFSAARADQSAMSVVEQSRQQGRGGYVRLYWGGAAYFLHADQALFEQTGLRLTDVIRQYLGCCQQRWGTNAQGMIRQFDRISRSKVFSEALAETVARRGFPRTQDALAWLAEHPPAQAR